MEQIARQLEVVRGVARWMLVGQRVFQWTAAVAAVVVVLAVVDYALRLPGWLRLIVGVALAVAAVVWIGGRLRRAWMFRPGLDQLALRLERMYPQVAGSLATAVDFTVYGEAAGAPARTASLIDAATWDLRSKLNGVDVRRLLDWSTTLRLLVVMAGSLVVVAALAVALPVHARIAAARWAAPLGGTEWPRRTEVSRVRTPTVWPVDTPLRLSALVSRGYQSGMRVSVDYRMNSDGEKPGGWQTLLMTEQSGVPSEIPAERLGSHDRASGERASGGRLFERQIEWPESLAKRLEASGGSMRVEYRFRGGDDDTSVQSLRLVARPAVTRVVAKIAPPAYARGLVEEQTVALHELSGQVASVSALRGSVVELAIGLNKRVVVPETIGDVLPEASVSARFESMESFDLAESVSLRFELRETVESPIRVADEHGLENLSERRYRIEAIEDKPPTVSLVKPATDESVLATAVVPVEAVGQDDVAVGRVVVEGGVEGAKPQATPGAQGADGGAAERAPEVLVEVEQRGVEVRGERGLDLGTWKKLEPGDVVVLHGVAEDVFELEGERHAAVRSSPRRLRIIDETTLITQLRTELGAVRQQAVRMEQQQRRAIEAPPETPEAADAAEQGDLTRRIEAQEKLVRDLAARAERNRLEDAALREMVGKAGALLNEAAGASRGAAGELREAETGEESAKPQALREAKGEQEKAAEKLGEVISLLDQGGDAMSLELALRQLHAAQANLEEEARKAFPLTAGQDRTQLPQELRDKLDDLAGKQAAAAEQARELVRQMQDSAHRLNQQAGDDRAQAAAQVLAEAAAIAQRQGLEQSMEKAGEQIGENQLSQAAQEQAASMETLSRMMSQMGTQQQRMQAMLKRRLQKLAEAIQALVERQKGEVASLDGQADDAVLPGLEPGMAALRRSTMAVEEEARAEQGEQVAGMAAAGEQLGRAVKSQGDAVLALRGSQRMPAKVGETDALSSLEEALRLVREMRQKAAEEEAKKERAEIRAEYEKLAERQEQLRVATEPYAKKPVLDRKEQREVRDLGQQQADVQSTAGELRSKVEQTLVFTAMHNRIDNAAARGGRQLRGGQANTDVVEQQGQVAKLLRAMAAALQEDPKPEPFAGQQQQQQDGGGGGGGEQPQAVPPAAELKLLRGLQEAIYDQTKAMVDGDPGDAGKEAMLELSVRQRELSALGDAMIQKMKQGVPGGMSEGQP